MRKYLVYETDKLLVGKRIAQFGECRRESAIVPLMRSFIRYMEDVPKVIAFYLVVTPDSAHVTQFSVKLVTLGMDEVSYTVAEGLS